MGERGVHKELWWGSLRKINHLKDPGLDRTIILKWIFDKCNEEHGVDYSG
jgi:hypothetical protein